MTTSLTKERENMNDTDKKKWSTPKLRIFTRTTAEERVLAGCKLLIQSSGRNNLHNRCLRVDCTGYLTCSSITGS